MASAESPPTAAEQVDNLLHSRSPTLLGNRLVCIDGHAGSGKTTLAEQLRQVLARRGIEATVLHTDDLYPGWDGLADVASQLEGVVLPLAAGRPGRYRRYDWATEQYAEEHAVQPVAVLVIEGVGSAASTIADLSTVTVWVAAPHALRMRRGIERDGQPFAARWDRWATAETRHFAAEKTPSRADLVVDGATGSTTPGPAG